MKRFFALMCAMMMLTLAVPASADGLGDFLGGIFDGSKTETTETDGDYFTGDTVTADINGTKVQVHAKFKQVMDEYEAFFDEYIAFMQNPTDMMKYASFMTQYAETMAALSNLEDEESEMSTGDLAYYTYVMSDVTVKLMTVTAQ